MSSKGVRVTVDTNFCQGIGYCERICPSVFKVDKATGYAVVLQAEVTDAEMLALVDQAEQTCPTRAIELVPIG